MPRTLDIQSKVAALRRFYRREGRAPGYSEMVALLGYRSKSAVFKLLRRLERERYVHIEPGGKLVFTGRIKGTIKILGTVQAGFPSPAEEELVDIKSLDDYLIRNPDATYLLKVDGDSMIEEGIKPGDILLVESGRSPKSGDIVVAQVDDQWTLKFYVKERGQVRLEAANRKYKPITPRHSLIVGGVVRAVIRKYGH